jgi:hypothetical protein
MRNPSTSRIHHDFDTSRWGNPSTTLFTSISMGEPLHCPRSPRFRWGKPSNTPIHLDFNGGNPPTPPFTSISMGKPLHCPCSPRFQWENPSAVHIHLDFDDFDTMSQVNSIYPWVVENP